MQATLERMQSAYPHYHERDRLAILTSGRESITALECLDLPISDADKLWLVLRPELIDLETVESLAHEFCDAVLPHLPGVTIDEVRRYAETEGPLAAYWRLADWVGSAAQTPDLSISEAQAARAKAEAAVYADQVEIVRKRLAD